MEPKYFTGRVGVANNVTEMFGKDYIAYSKHPDVWEILPYSQEAFDALAAVDWEEFVVIRALSEDSAKEYAELAFLQWSAAEGNDENSVTRGDVRIVWSRLGEGYNGDYNPNDPQDQELLRFDLWVKYEGRWEMAEGGSYCTLVPVTATPAQRFDLLLVLMDKLYDAVVKGEYYRDIADRMSGMRLEWLDNPLLIP